MRYQIVLSAFILFISRVCSIRILGVFYIPSISHQTIFQPIWRELSLRGHDVTVITTNPLKDPRLINLTEIDVSFSYEFLIKSNVQSKLSKDSSIFNTVPFLNYLGATVMEDQLKYEAVSNLIKDNSTEFDLILFQNSHVFPLVHGYIARYGCPAVGISSLDVFLHTHDAFGNPTHPVASPDMMLKFVGNLSFFDKVQSLLYNIWYRIFYHWYALPHADKIARKYFGNDIPYLGDVEKNVSLMLMNVNPLIHGVRPNVPNVIEINQIHIKEKRNPLPQDIQQILDNSPQGVVYFSLGSNVKSANLPPKLIQVIVEGLKELPYTVLWKWETDHLPNQPKNVIIRKWLPQQDILYHPNVKVFVTQGGLQSLEEAISNAVPLVGMPFITDQPINIRKIVSLGMGVGVDPQTLTSKELKEAIIEVVQNEKYKKEVLRGRSILRDQPMKGVEKAVWWIEYVIRHNGARHLRSPATDMSFFEYFMVDVIIFLLVSVFICLYSAYKVISFIMKCIRRTHKIKTS